MEEHPTSEDFARFLQQSSRPSHAEQNALIVRHLLAGCAACRRTLRETKGVPGLLERLLEIPLQAETETPKAYNYEWIFAKTERARGSLLAEGLSSEHVPELLAELARLPEGQQLQRVGEDPRFADTELIHCLIQRSHAARYRSPRKTLHWARLAQRASLSLTPEQTGGNAALADLQAQALGQYGNTLRIAGKPLEAEQAFAAADRCRKAGSGDCKLHAWLIEKAIPLLIFQSRFTEAVAMAEKAGAIYEESGEKGPLASILVQKAIAQLYSGEVEIAVKTLNEARPLICAEEDPYLLLAAQHNLARCHIDLDRPDEALALYCEARELYRKCKDPLIFLRASWQEGQLLREIGHLHNAEVALLRARKGFIEQGLAYESALVALDLAEVYSKLGDQGRVRRIVSEALPIFRSLRIGLESLASLLQLKRTEEPPEVP